MTEVIISLIGLFVACVFFFVLLAVGLLGVMGDDWRGEP